MLDWTSVLDTLLRMDVSQTNTVLGHGLN